MNRGEDGNQTGALTSGILTSGNFTSGINTESGEVGLSTAINGRMNFYQQR